MHQIAKDQHSRRHMTSPSDCTALKDISSWTSKFTASQRWLLLNNYIRAGERITAVTKSWKFKYKADSANARGWASGNGLAPAGSSQRARSLVSVTKRGRALRTHRNCGGSQQRISFITRDLFDHLNWSSEKRKNNRNFHSKNIPNNLSHSSDRIDPNQLTSLYKVICYQVLISHINQMNYRGEKPFCCTEKSGWVETNESLFKYLSLSVAEALARKECAREIETWPPQIYRQ